MFHSGFSLTSDIPAAWQEITGCTTAKPEESFEFDKKRMLPSMAPQYKLPFISFRARQVTNGGLTAGRLEGSGATIQEDFETPSRSVRYTA